MRFAVVSDASFDYLFGRPLKIVSIRFEVRGGFRRQL